MDTNGANTRVQPSIRSFFQPRQPSYTMPPGSSPPPQPSPSSLPRATPSAPIQPSTNTSQAIPPATRTPILPPQATISSIQQLHIQPLRRINALLLPIHYPDSFYHKILSPDPPTPSNGFSRAILWTDPTTQETKVVGGVVCRLDPALSESSTAQNPVYTPDAYDIYVQSLVLLSPYRGKGLVAAVLNEIIEAATQQNEIRIDSLYAHVWTKNEEALDWYAARGFKREEPVIHGYYRRLDPDTAFLYRRRLVPSDHLASPPELRDCNSLPVSKVSTPTTATRPPISMHARSFQDKGPEREWNDLPEDILGGGLLKTPSALGSRQGSAASSRSSSRSVSEVKAKKKRAYPAAAFGSLA
ncbi:hypothetical protein QTJ16_003087 [Diplocarpon rosae]|uniref:N-acetyltransferase domain-containing protein n=1 Tax=Diplocarpon rosae TaxID=946125 RepID=A0AAD9WF86_9HELO|nr:hypothetical protein QTJ16_003087 [Diplocarpon rosae]PBP27692.1 GCN5-related N acetyltransferase [Diplocarpon rosae]